MDVPNCLTVNGRQSVQRSPCQIVKSPSNNLAAVGNRRGKLVRQILEMDKETSNGRYCKWRAGEARQPVVVNAVVPKSPNMSGISTGRVAKIQASQKIQQTIQLENARSLGMSIPRPSRRLKSVMGMTSSGVRRQSSNVKKPHAVDRVGRRVVQHLRKCSVDITKIRMKTAGNFDVRVDIPEHLGATSCSRLESVDQPGRADSRRRGVDNPVQQRSDVDITKFSGCGLQLRRTADSPRRLGSGACSRIDLQHRNEPVQTRSVQYLGEGCLHLEDETENVDSFVRSRSSRSSSISNVDCLDGGAGKHMFDSNHCESNNTTPCEDDRANDEERGNPMIPYQMDHPVSLHIHDSSAWMEHSQLPVEQYPVPRLESAVAEDFTAEQAVIEDCHVLSSDDFLRVNDDGVLQEDSSTVEYDVVSSPGVQQWHPVRAEVCSSPTADMVHQRMMRVFPVPAQGVHVCQHPANVLLHQRLVPVSGSMLPSPPPPAVICVNLDEGDISFEAEF